jgi:hypothetical protein
MPGSQLASGLELALDTSGLRRYVRTAITATIHTLALLMDTTALAGSRAVSSSELARGTTVSTVPAFMVAVGMVADGTEAAFTDAAVTATAEEMPALHWVAASTGAWPEAVSTAALDSTAADVGKYIRSLGKTRKRLAESASRFSLGFATEKTELDLLV